MSGAENARRRVVQRRIGGAEMSLPPYSDRYIKSSYRLTEQVLSGGGQVGRCSLAQETMLGRESSSLFVFH